MSIHKKGIKIFKRYLKEQGIYALFFREVELFKKSNHGGFISLKAFHEGNLSSLFKACENNPVSIIDKSFDWEYSLMGNEFWNHHYYEFYKYYENFESIKNEQK